MPDEMFGGNVRIERLATAVANRGFNLQLSHSLSMIAPAR
jgi:hypothetical protein